MYYLIFVQIALSVVVFIALFFYTAPYGRHVIKNVKHPHKLSARVGWFMMEIPAMATILVISTILYPFFLKTNQIKWAPLVFIAMWEFHYIYRGIIYPLFLSSKQNNMPFLIALSGLFFNLINGSINAWWLLQVKEYSITEFYSPHFLIGTFIFFLGFSIHAYSDKTLRIIKKNNTDYIVPKVFPHTLIAAPNYLGEIIQWIGWAVATWSLAGFAFALFTFANLLPRAYAHLKWYRKNFKDYPKNRKALIPFIL